MPLHTGVITVSDGCSQGEREDVSGRLLAETLQGQGYEIVYRALVPDEIEQIADALLAACELCDVVLTTGGTGFAPRDITPEATRRVIEREAPGLAELLRWTGYQKLPRAVLSRGVAGIRGRALLINLPGSTGGVRDGLEVLLPLLPHAVALLKDETVDHSPGATQGRTPDSMPAPPSTVAVIETNLDDLSPEFYDVAQERLFAAGALDVFWQPIQMKKNRPALLLTVLAPPSLTDALAQILFSETTTFGLRVTTAQRLVLERHHVTVATAYGDIRVKVGSWRGIETTAAPEYEDVKTAARAHNVPVKSVYAAAQHVYAEIAEPTI